MRGISRFLLLYLALTLMTASVHLIFPLYTLGNSGGMHHSVSNGELGTRSMDTSDQSYQAAIAGRPDDRNCRFNGVCFFPVEALIINGEIPTAHEQDLPERIAESTAAGKELEFGLVMENLRQEKDSKPVVAPVVVSQRRNLTVR